MHVHQAVAVYKTGKYSSERGIPKEERFFCLRKRYRQPESMLRA